jgi:membrane protease YdiL (CAAX protease family)
VSRGNSRSQNPPDGLLGTLGAVTDGYPYHRLDRADPRYRWWKPLVVAALALVIYLALSALVLVLAELYARRTMDVGDYAAYNNQVSVANVVLTQPLAIAVLLASVAMMTPSLMLARLIVRAGGIGRLSSVAGGLRWRWLAICVLPALAYVLAQVLASFVVVPAVTGDGLGAPTADIHQFLIALAVIVVLVPFQASAEEYVFRGFILQSVGGWVRWPVIAIACSALPFVFGHLYNWWGLGEILAFALVTAWLTIRTGGLEAAIVLHILSNLMALGVPAAGFDNLTVANGSPESLIIAVVLLPLYGLGVDRLFRRAGLSNVTPAQRNTAELHEPN